MVQLVPEDKAITSSWHAGPKFPTRTFALGEGRRAEEVTTMQEAKTYRRYAADCIRMAEKLSDAKDKKILMEIAKAWELRAQEAERRQKN